MYVCMHLSIYLFIYLSVCLSVCLSVSLKNLFCFLEPLKWANVFIITTRTPHQPVDHPDNDIGWQSDNTSTSLFSSLTLISLFALQLSFASLVHHVKGTENPVNLSSLI